MKTAKLENLTATEITAISNYLKYNIGLSPKLARVAKAYNNNWDAIQKKLHQTDRG